MGYMETQKRMEQIKGYIQTTLEEMQRTLDDKEWAMLHERYLEYKMELRKIKAQNN